jgi:asparagine synthase (glutamine-hydrolysing)
MCGFYFTNIKPKNFYFLDVISRGLDYCVFDSNDYFAIQSVLPCVNTIDFTIYESKEYLFLYTGEIYNYDRNFNSDTEMFFYDLIHNRNISNYNGMYAYVLYNKKTKNIKYGRDKTGQIPLFVYNKAGQIIISNTIKSIVKSISPSLNTNSLLLWKKSKHYIFNETPWQDIYLVPPSSTERLVNSKKTIKETFQELQLDYVSKLSAASINSGGVDSGIVSKWFGQFEVAINHVGKDFVSNKLSFAFDVEEDEWIDYVNNFIQDVYLFPYTWSWVGYYILGKKLQKKINILYTGEGADEIFGGYPGYAKGERTPYSDYFPIYGKNFLVENKLSDQKYFIPIATMGANLALGNFCIEARSPFLDRRFLNNKNYYKENDKKILKEYYKELYKKDYSAKQGFAGFPDEYGKNTSWKDACFEQLKTLI